MTDLVDWFVTLLPGLLVSLQVTALALLFGLPLGLVLALIAEFGTRLGGWIVVVIVEIGRGIPALVVLYLVYFGLPDAGVVLDAFWSVVAAFAFTTSAYTSEILRGALRGVHRGQFEAAEALGLMGVDRYVYIIVPQAVKIAAPALFGFAILVFQGSSLAYAVALPEMLSRAYSIGTISFHYLGVLLLAGGMYAAVTIGGEALFTVFGRRLRAPRRTRSTR